jgi:hypothetical protein
MYRSVPALVLLMLALQACGSGDSRSAQPAKGFERDASVHEQVLDHDGDGLCDSSERDFGTDPRAADSDGDGLPDLIELANGFDAVNRDEPGPDEITYLDAKPGASTDFPVRATFDGEGEGVSGYFDAISSIYSDGSTAQDFYRGTAAVSADPIDSVRGIEQDSARFAAVLGHARLGFILHFEYMKGGPDVDCARAYPFRYSLKTDNGDVLGDRLFLLVVGAGAGAAADLGFCLPSGCQ